MNELMKHIMNSVRRGCLTLTRRPVLYFTCIILIPLSMTAFFVSLMNKGVADRVPSAIVDLDHSATSRNLSRTLGSMQQIDVKYKLNSYAEAMNYVKENKIMGFFLIPEEFGSKTLAGRQPELTYYINFGYFVPGSLLIKGYTTTSLSANAAVIQGVLSAHGIDENDIKATLQPFINDIHALGNPHMNYGVYLANSFAPGVLALMIMLVTCYYISMEIKHETTREWLNTGGGSIIVSLFGKLCPLTIFFTLTGWLIQIILFGIAHYPMNGNIWIMFQAMFLLVTACQSFAVIVCCILPNPRYALSICSLMGVLAFSLGGYSFPVEDMYPGVAIFSYLLPVRYYFLIYTDQALNGLDIAYSRYYFVALSVFPLISFLLLQRLKRACIKPVIYVP